MKHAPTYIAVMFGLTVACGVNNVLAQTTANGPYYATPSWDQQLPASTRFIVLANWGNAAVLDRETGLVWERSPDTSTFDWLHAERHCNELNLGNRRGWRAPAVQELASLLDGDPANASSPRLPPGHPFVNVLVNTSYLSATPQTDSPTTGAWAVNFNSGTVSDGAGKQNPRPIWCVRGGQGVLPPS